MSIKWRMPLAVNVLVGTIAPLCYLYTILHFIFGHNVFTSVQTTANFAFSAYAVMYIMGLQVNLWEHGMQWWAYPFWYIVQIILFPILAFLENISVLYAIVRPSTGFHVVKKC